MSLYQRRRRSPIHITVRQDGLSTRDDQNPDSPKSPDTPFSASTTSPSPTTLSTATTTLSPPATPTTFSTATTTLSPPVIPTSTPSSSLSPIAVVSSALIPTSTVSSKPAASPQSTIVAISSTRAVIVTSTTSSLALTTKSAPSSISSKIAALQSTSTSTSTTLPSALGGSIVADDPPRVPGHRGAVSGMGTGARAALITTTILGGLALIIGAIWYFRRRRRLRDEREMRHAEGAFNPGNIGSLSAPETTHVSNSSASSNLLFAPAPYSHPNTVTTDRSSSRSNSRVHRFFPSRIATPEPTPNPFADPPRNKAYDQLRGRPRSTTLTDRGSWVENPFRDPMSDRFDPFGELQERAREERRKYVEELKRGEGREKGKDGRKG